MAVSIDKLSDEISKILADYSEDIKQEVNAQNKITANTVCKSLKNNNSIPQRNGDYKKSFYVKTVKSGTDVSYILANKLYRLTHLLENGHRTRNGGKSKAFVHWKTAEQQVIALTDQAMKNIGG